MFASGDFVYLKDTDYAKKYNIVGKSGIVTGRKYADGSIIHVKLVNSSDMEDAFCFDSEIGYPYIQMEIFEIV